MSYQGIRAHRSELEVFLRVAHDYVGAVVVRHCRQQASLSLLADQQKHRLTLIDLIVDQL